MIRGIYLLVSHSLPIMKGWFAPFSRSILSWAAARSTAQTLPEHSSLHLAVEHHNGEISPPPFWKEDLAFQI
jgi:hypothetical protein